jgi:hypothetical protein
MCLVPKAPSAPPPPPPPAPPINPIEIGATDEAQVRGKRRKLGVAALQIPLVPSAAAGLGIPKVGA